MHTECKDCKFRKGDCGHHFLFNGVVNYDIPSQTACDNYDNCMFFKRDEEKTSEGDLISREDLKEQIKEDLCKRRCPMPEKEKYCNPNCSARLFMSIIDNAPTVEQSWRFYYDHGYAQAKRDFERPTGEWILTYPYQDRHEVHRECSVCGDARYIDDREYFVNDNFCPECGAKMESCDEMR